VKCSKVSLTFVTLALGLASAANIYHLTVADPTWIGGNELQPGDYKVDVEDNKAVIEQGKLKIEVPATVQSNDRKYSNTSILTETVNGKKQLDEIQFGGTKTRLVFHSGSAGASGSE
jgi:hypothetical protein